jgi:hypothetical protein
VVSFLYSYYDRVVVLAFLPLSDIGVYDVARAQGELKDVGGREWVITESHI